MSRVAIYDRDIDMGYGIWDMGYGHPDIDVGYIWDIDMGESRIDTVILDIDVGCLVTLAMCAVSSLVRGAARDGAGRTAAGGRAGPCTCFHSCLCNYFSDTCSRYQAGIG